MNPDIHHGDTPVSPQLGQDEIHLWCCDDEKVTDAALIHRYESWLDAGELARMQQFLFPGHRHRFLLARALVRFALSSYCPSLNPADWRFGTNDHGRPVIDNRQLAGSELAFNLSHTRGLTVLAICHHGELGVDVENCERPGDATLISDQFFSPLEVRELKALPESQQLLRSIDHWTLKEAYIKARGMGLAIPLGSFSFDLSSPGLIGFSVGPEAEDRADGWQFWQLKPGAIHRIAVAHRFGESPSPMRLRCFQVVPDMSIQAVSYTVCSASS